jgi:hypothetical protein
VLAVVPPLVVPPLVVPLLLVVPLSAPLLLRPSHYLLSSLA